MSDPNNLVRDQLRAHTNVIDALRQTQNDHYREFTEFRAEMRQFRSETLQFQSQTAVGFARLHAGQEHITRLIESIADR